MSFLLKIIKGSNAGAEIALAEGVVSFGSGDSCDIVLADATLPAEAFSLETTADGVALKMLPDGESKSVALYTVFSAGAMEFAVGEDGVTWPELKRPEPPPKEAETLAPEVKQPEAPASAEAKPKPETKQPEPKERHGVGCLVSIIVVLLLIVFFAVGYWLALRYQRAQFSGCGYKVDLKALEVGKDDADDGAMSEVKAPEPPKYTMEDLAAETGLLLCSEDGVRKLSGNFSRRIDRLNASAKAYELDCEVRQDLSDDETLKSGVDETLFMLTGGKVTACIATNRFVKLVGAVRTHKLLLDTVAALCADVNHLRRVDDTAVVCGDGKATTQPTDYKAVGEDNHHPFVPQQTRHGIPAPKCPVAGVIVTPYPCLVMRDGSRVSEGAEIDGWTVIRIGEHEVVLRQGKREVKWRP